MKATNYKFLILIFIQAALVMSCNKKDDNTPITQQGRCDSRNPGACISTNPVTQSSADISLAGRFVGQDQNGFQYNAAGLTSATIPEAALGSVSDGQYDGTGIGFGAKVILNGNIQLANAPANTAISTNSRLSVGVYDSFVGQADPSGKVIGPLMIPMSRASGTMGANKADVTFQDDFGTIQFTGTYDAQNFTGTARYVNKVKVDDPNNQGAYGTFSFTISTCSFFVCN